MEAVERASPGEFVEPWKIPCRPLQLPFPRSLGCQLELRLERPFGLPGQTVPKPELERPSLEADPEWYNSVAAKSYRTALKAYKDSRYKFIYETSAVGAILSWFWAFFYDLNGFLFGVTPSELGSPVFLTSILLAVALFRTPCYADLRNTWKLRKRCNDLHKALPYGVDAVPLDWTFEDEAKLSEATLETLPYKALQAGVTWVAVMLPASALNALFPAATAQEQGFRFVWAISETTVALGWIFDQLIRISALDARKQESLSEAE